MDPPRRTTAQASTDAITISTFRLQDLPPRALACIACLLPVPTLLNLAATSCRMRQLCLHDASFEARLALLGAAPRIPSDIDLDMALDPAAELASLLSFATTGGVDVHLPRIMHYRRLREAQRNQQRTPAVKDDGQGRRSQGEERGGKNGDTGAGVKKENDEVLWPVLSKRDDKLNIYIPPVKVGDKASRIEQLKIQDLKQKEQQSKANNGKGDDDTIGVKNKEDSEPQETVNQVDPTAEAPAEVNGPRPSTINLPSFKSEGDNNPWGETQSKSPQSPEMSPSSSFHIETVDSRRGTITAFIPSVNSRITLDKQVLDKMGSIMMDSNENYSSNNPNNYVRSGSYSASNNPLVLARYPPYRRGPPNTAKTFFFHIYNRLLPFYNDLLAKQKDSILFTNFDDIQFVSAILKRLSVFHRLVQTGSSSTSTEAKYIIESTIDWFESTLLNQFERAYNANNIADMQKYAISCYNLNGGKSCVNLFISKNPIFFDSKFNPTKLTTMIQQQQRQKRKDKRNRHHRIEDGDKSTKSLVNVSSTEANEADNMATRRGAGQDQMNVFEIVDEFTKYSNYILETCKSQSEIISKVFVIPKMDALTSFALRLYDESIQEYLTALLTLTREKCQPVVYLHSLANGVYFSLQFLQLVAYNEFKVLTTISQLRTPIIGLCSRYSTNYLSVEIIYLEEQLTDIVKRWNYRNERRKKRVKSASANVRHGKFRDDDDIRAQNKRERNEHLRAALADKNGKGKNKGRGKYVTSPTDPADFDNSIINNSLYEDESDFANVSFSGNRRLSNFTGAGKVKRTSKGSITEAGKKLAGGFMNITSTLSKSTNSLNNRSHTLINNIEEEEYPDAIATKGKSYKDDEFDTEDLNEEDKEQFADLSSSRVNVKLTPRSSTMRKDSNDDVTPDLENDIADMSSGSIELGFDKFTDKLASKTITPTVQSPLHVVTNSDDRSLSISPHKSKSNLKDSGISPNVDDLDEEISKMQISGKFIKSDMEDGEEDDNLEEQLSPAISDGDSRDVISPISGENEDFVITRGRTGQKTLESDQPLRTSSNIRTNLKDNDDLYFDDLDVFSSKDMTKGLKGSRKNRNEDDYELDDDDDDEFSYSDSDLETDSDDEYQLRLQQSQRKNQVIETMRNVLFAPVTIGKNLVDIGRAGGAAIGSKFMGGFDIGMGNSENSPVNTPFDNGAHGDYFTQNGAYDTPDGKTPLGESGYSGNEEARERLAASSRSQKLLKQVMAMKSVDNEMDPIDRSQALISIELCLELLQVDIESLGRTLIVLSVVNGGVGVVEGVGSVFTTLLDICAKMHIQPAFDKAITMLDKVQLLDDEDEAIEDAHRRIKADNLSEEKAKKDGLEKDKIEGDEDGEKDDDSEEVRSTSRSATRAISRGRDRSRSASQGRTLADTVNIDTNADYKRTVAPSVISFFRVIQTADIVQQMYDIYYQEDIKKWVNESDQDFMTALGKSKKRFDHLLDDCAATGMDKCLRIMINQLEYIYLLELDPLNYNPEATLEDATDGPLAATGYARPGKKRLSTSSTGSKKSSKAPPVSIVVMDVHPTKLCKRAKRLLTEFWVQINKIADRHMVEVFFCEASVRMFDVIIKHLKRIHVSQSGAFQLLCDFNEYHDWAKSTKIQGIIDQFSTLKEIVNIFLADGTDDLRRIVMDVSREHNSQIRLEDMQQLLRSRADYRRIHKKLSTSECILQ